MVRSLLFFVLAGLCEIGGGYLVWLALREGKSPWLAVLGVAILGIYGAVPTLQPTHFGRAYAAYGDSSPGMVCATWKAWARMGCAASACPRSP
ncbi:YnfA family protein [Leptolyngbya sp. KIOST-1]|uniref:YnfA family protein n=1 Tax=Leptolyngbya sp. KIOST-1 TaxID=1229172 RepID=UPI0021F13C06|nr:YnfA family protein [Leptolyngbya sp. KIOST-1]